jgi:predicted DNA-binding protein YlxM (UPF0122 family)
MRQPSNEPRSAFFYRTFLPLRAEMIALLAASYRQYFKIALAHPSDTGEHPELWAWIQLQPAIHAAIQWIRDWYVLACDGENRKLVTLGNVPVLPGQTTVTTEIHLSKLTSPPSASPWRAPACLFGVSLALYGIGMLKPNHVPSRETAERLGPSHSRLLLKGAKRLFLWELEKTVETVRNEEIAAAGAIPSKTADGQKDELNKRNSKSSLKGLDGLSHKSVDLSQYMHNLTEKQQLALSLRLEYELSLGEVASRMGLDRKTAYEHIEAAKRKIDQAHSREKSKARHPKRKDE